MGLLFKVTKVKPKKFTIGDEIKVSVMVLPNGNAQIKIDAPIEIDIKMEVDEDARKIFEDKRRKKINALTKKVLFGGNN